LSTLLVASWVAGAGLALGAVALVYRLADAYPAFPPPPSFPMPGPTLLASALAAVGTAAFACLVLQRLLDRIAPAELLRAPPG
jgi:hypothetical protein